MSHDALMSDRLERGSDRSFGLVIAVALAIVASAPLLRDESPRLPALAVAFAFAAIAILAPSRLARLNALWFSLGQTLNKIVNPIVMGALFFCVLTPIAFVFRLLARDLLALHFDETAESYWTRRDADGPGDMRKQF